MMMMMVNVVGNKLGGVVKSIHFALHDDFSILFLSRVGYKA
jgi:hypothetical protein